MRDIILTRVELYELLWQEPTRTVASDLGLSDVGLVKRCSKARIPYPGRGYWAKVAAGQAPRRPRLPDPDHNPSFGFSGPRPAPAAPPASSKEPYALLPTEFALRAFIAEVLTAQPSPPTRLRIDDRLPFYQTESDDSRRRARMLLANIIVLADALEWAFVPLGYHLIANN